MAVTSHEIVQYFTCERKGYFLLKDGCVSAIMASFLREQVRVIDEFCKHFFIKNTHFIESHTSLKEAAEETQRVFQSHTVDKDIVVAHAVFSAEHTLYAYVPMCTWNNKLNAWVLHFCTAYSGIRNEHKLHVACALSQCKKLNIPVAQVFLHFLVTPDEEKNESKADVCWNESDITDKAEQYLNSITTKLQTFLEFVDSPEALVKENWKKCNRQYCDVCSVTKIHDVHDINTLRKSKFLIDDLLAQDITRIEDIPSSIELSTVVSRQVESVKENKQLFFEDEIQQFLQQLTYPRYYLDFEAFSITVPSVSGVKINGFVPFLFSLQWQDCKDGVIHTQLWAMPCASDKRLKMWQELSASLSRAGCVVVYNSNFEEDMIKQLSSIAKEQNKGYRYISKIVDLQKIFMDLSVYKPEQKGKIALKIITALWLGGDYKTLKVSEGMFANYFYTAMTDTKNDAFKKCKQSRYIHNLCEKIYHFDNQYDITINDIAQYCKYDTQVMIQLVALLEKMYNTQR